MSEPPLHRNCNIPFFLLLLNLSVGASLPLVSFFFNIGDDNGSEILYLGFMMRVVFCVLSGFPKIL